MTDLGSSTNTPVYIGVWTNWSRGRIAGATLTLSHRNGAFLTASLAIFVTFVGTSFWCIASFALHQFLSSEIPKDGLYHQTQAILRNSGSGTNGLTRLLSLLWVWRHRAKRPFYRTLPLIAAIALSTAVFAVASIFSAKVSSGMSDEVLVSSNSCGQIDQGDLGVTNTERYYEVFYPWQSKKANSYANYVQTCYTNVSDAEGCSTYIKRQLPSNIDRNASCPFQGDICRHNYGNIKLDTGYLSLDSDLGLNVPAHLRYKFRIIHHCAPLITDGHKQVFDYSSDISYMNYFYGPAVVNPPSAPQPNFTYQYPMPSVSPNRMNTIIAESSDYSIQILPVYTYNGTLYYDEGGFLPDDELSQTLTDSDLLLMFLSGNRVIHTEPVNDDWYAAHRFAGIFNESKTEGIREYMADEPASPLACKAHYQACIPGSSSEECSVSGGSFDITYPNVSKESEAYTIIPWIANPFFGIWGVIDSLKTSSLTSRSSLYGSVQGPLPDNQWQLDVEYWHNVALASLQDVAGNAIGPDDPNVLKYYWKLPDSNIARNLCKSQKIRSSSYSNFSVLGLAIILVVGGLIIILRCTLEPAIDFIEHRLRKTKYSRLEWTANDILQTQRLAHEELGMGTWDDCVNILAVPVTDKDQMLAILDIKDPKHPRLKAPSVAKDGENVMGKIDTSSTQIGNQEKSEPDSAATAVEEHPTVLRTATEATIVATESPTQDHASREVGGLATVEDERLCSSSGEERRA